jgi:hypothetical protein
MPKRKKKMKFKAKEKDGRLYVSATIHAALQHEASTSISTQDVMGWVGEHYPRYKNASILKKGAAYNGATQKERTGVWVLGLKTKAKTKPQTKPQTESPKKMTRD